ncbi:MAG: hypothetical protein IKI11_06220 [Neisseriaceae bacterium]|nr:hypothetical protein [Neisseriaceae bacterium]
MNKNTPFRLPEKASVIARRQLAVSGLPLTDMSPRAVRRGGLEVKSWQSS